MTTTGERAAFVLGLGIGLLSFGVAYRTPVGDACLWALLFVGAALAWVGFFTHRAARAGVKRSASPPAGV